MKRNNDFIKRWIRWLRETDFEQTDGELREDDSFCCLGIACHYSTKMKRKKRFEADKIHYQFTETNDEHYGYLPADFRRWVGLTYDEELELMEMNDEGKSFDEIADWLEENVYKQEPDFFQKEN